MKQTIRLSNSRTGWLAEHLDARGKPDENIISLFGTNILPTPFTHLAGWKVIFSEISRLNPEKNVVVIS